MINLKKADDNILTLIFDNRESPVNLINESFLTHLETLVEELTRDEHVQGIIFTSNKRDFLSGADLDMFLNTEKASQALQQSRKLQSILRKLETWEKPVVAAINGSALGGGLELALACQHRIAINHRSLKFGLPEVTLGIMPGGGGTQRIIRTIGIEKGLPLLLQGNTVSPIQGKELGFIDTLVDTQQELMETAKAFIEQNPRCQQPWDRSGNDRDPYDPRTEKGRAFFSVSSSMLAEKARGKGDGPLSILKAVYEGSQLTLEPACEVEARYFASLLSKPITKNIIQTAFHAVQRCRKLGDHLTEEAQPIKSIGIIGAGVMGQGIAHVAVKLGLEVLLKDNDLSTAEMGKNNISKVLDKGLSNIIQTTDNFEDFKSCDLIVECVSENSDLKKALFKEIEEHVSEETIIATNTSSLPLSMLGNDLSHPERFLGLHFFSPVPKMPLVEIIKAEKTNQTSLIRTLKFAKALKKTPILVRDGHGFFTTRVFCKYITEGVALLREGFPAPLIENAGKLLGFPLGPLEIADEVSLSLIKNLLQEKLKYLKTTEFTDPTEKVTLQTVQIFVDNNERFGKKSKKGFYDYPAEKTKSLAQKTLSYEDPEKREMLEVCKDRLFSIQLVEALKCYEEGIINTAHEGDVASIFGWGFPVSTGGIISACHHEGNDKFLEKLIKLQSQWGDRFAPPKILKTLINKNYNNLYEAREILAQPFLED